MKDIISKNKTSSSCSRFYINDGVTITSDKKKFAEKFNSFVINVGPNLAKEKFRRIPNRQQDLWLEISTAWQYYQSPNLKLAIS